MEVRVVETTVRVRYAETDQMGVAYYANFFVWMEMGRTEYCRACGFTYREMEECDGAYIIVAEAHCQYKAPARYDDLLLIRTRLVESRSRVVTFYYEILNQETGQLLATGETTHVVTDKNGRPRTLPERYRHHFPLKKREKVKE